MIQVELGDLKKFGEEISEVLHDKLRRDVSVKGSKLIISEESNGPRVGVKEVKVQVKHALHHLGLSGDYRVLAEHGTIRIVKEEEKRRPAVERKSVAPPPAKSLPYFFP